MSPSFSLVKLGPYFFYWRLLIFQTLRLFLVTIASALCVRYAPYIHAFLQEGYDSPWPVGRRCCRFLWSQRCCKASTRSRRLLKIWWRTQYFEQLCRLIIFTICSSRVLRCFRPGPVNGPACGRFESDLSQPVKPESSILTLVWW